jgi:hypothetical protein
MSSKKKHCLNPIFTEEIFTLDPCEDSSIWGASEIFPGGIHPNFEEYAGNIKGQLTKGVSVQVCEMVKDGTFEKNYGSLDRSLDGLYFSQGQIKAFATKYSNFLHPEYSTFFLFSVDGQFLVANTYFLPRKGLKVDTYLLAEQHLWRSGFRHRFVIPQLNLVGN